MNGEKDKNTKVSFASLLAAGVVALAFAHAAPAAEGDEGAPRTDSELWNEGVELYRAGNATNALEVLRPLMLSRTHGARAAEVVAKLELEAAAKAATPADALKRREAAASAAQIALRSKPGDRRLNANFTRAVDGLDALRDARHVESVVEASKNADIVQMLRSGMVDTRRLVLEAAGVKTNEAAVAVAKADAMSASAARLSDVWIVAKAKAAEAAAASAMQGQQAQLPGQPGLSGQTQGAQQPGLDPGEAIAVMERHRERTREAARLLGDMDDDARYVLADVEGAFTECYKGVVLPPAAIREDQVCQSNAWLDVAEECGRPWQKEALDYTGAFRARFDEWAKMYEQQAASNTNMPPFSAEAQDEIRKLSAQLEKLQAGCCKAPSPPDQEESLRIIARIIELLPPQNGGGGNSSSQGASGDQSKDNNGGDDKKENKNDASNDQDPGKGDDNKDQEKPDDGDEKDDKKDEAPGDDENQPTPEEKEIEAVLKKAQERNDEHEAQKRARARKARLPPNERDW